MGRNREIGLSYFPFSVDTFSDIKIRKLIKYQGGKAVTVYALLLCLIYKRGYYMRWDEELPFIVSEQTGFEEAYIQEVINSCLALGLFSKPLYDSDRVLSSKGIQTRYAEAMNFFRRKTEICAFSLVSSEENGISSAFMPINSAKTPRKEKKGKEKKETNYGGKESPPSAAGGLEKPGMENQASINGKISPPKKNVGTEAGLVDYRKPVSWLMEVCRESAEWPELVRMKLERSGIFKSREEILSELEAFPGHRETYGLPATDTLRNFKSHFVNYLMKRFTAPATPKSGTLSQKRPNYANIKSEI